MTTTYQAIFPAVTKSSIQIPLPPRAASDDDDDSEDWDFAMVSDVPLDTSTLQQNRERRNSRTSISTAPIQTNVENRSPNTRRTSRRHRYLYIFFAMTIALTIGVATTRFCSSPQACVANLLENDKISAIFAPLTPPHAPPLHPSTSGEPHEPQTQRQCTHQENQAAKADEEAWLDDPVAQTLFQQMFASLQQQHDARTRRSVLVMREWIVASYIVGQSNLADAWHHVTRSFAWIGAAKESHSSSSAATSASSSSFDTIKPPIAASNAQNDAPAAPSGQNIANSPCTLSSSISSSANTCL
ncbi:hypothetical protein BC940DRAFT_309859 [Gongronella butleri]|nr:hypothetical protein BC940DRAFT_309859 [Gongronella butleri]